MKKILTLAAVLMLMLAALTLTAMAAEGDGSSVSDYTELPHYTEFPSKFDNAEFWDFYWYDPDASENTDSGIHENSFTSADGLTAFEYVYLKAYNGEDKSAAIAPEDARLVVEFEIDEPGKYDFLIEVMAYETYVPRTGLVQIDDGEKFYVSATHNTNHEVQEYFTGLSADLSVGTHTVTIYLAPDFDDSTVKSLFFDNFYYMLSDGTDVEEQETQPVETDDPNAPPFWYEGKDVVVHQSFDELRINDTSEGIFTPGQSAAWNEIAEVDDTVSTLAYWGWVALTGEVGTFGYQIDGNAPVFDDRFTVEAEQPVIDAATGSGGSYASRMLISIDLAGLQGEHKVRVLYKDTADNTVTLGKFELIRGESGVDPAPESKPVETEEPTSAESETAAESETVLDTADPESQTAAPESSDKADSNAGDKGGCASAVLALPVLMSAMAAAVVLRRRKD